MDIVERLRIPVGIYTARTHALAMEAADEVNRLRQKIEILEAELRVAYKLPAAVNAAVDAALTKGDDNA